MPNTFDDAIKATEDMFGANPPLDTDNADPNTGETPPQGTENQDGQGNPPEPTATEPNAENQGAQDNAPATPPETPPNGQQSVLDDAVNTAETAAQAAAQSAQELEMLRQQNAQLQGQNQQLQNTIDELSQRNQQNMIEDALEPPTLDVNALAFADEETVRAAQADYAAKMTEYTKKQMMKELSPALEFAKEGMREKEKAEVLTALSQIPELNGIRDMLPQLDRIIANNKWLQSDDMPMDEKYINAFAMAKGVNSMNTPPPAPPAEPTTDELMELYNKNPEFQELVEKQRLEQIKQSQQVPPFSASSGAVNAALNIKEKPKTFEEASERTRQMFGGV